MSARSLAGVIACVLASACSGDGGAIGAGGAGGAGGEGAGGAGGAAARDWTECQGSDQAWVRKALLAVTGRPAKSQAEVDVLEDLITKTRALRGGDLPSSASGPVPATFADLDEPRRVAARAMMADPAYAERWRDFLLDALRVARIEFKSQRACYGAPVGPAGATGALAAWVRDHDPADSGNPAAGFSLGDLARSALALDDVSPLQRAHLFAMITHALPGANVEPLELEIARRHDFGAAFEASYTRRDLVCLTCHNSEFSVTASDDPAVNRAWPVPGRFEASLFGRSDGRHPGEEPTRGPDLLRSRAMFRFAGVADAGHTAPWGWRADCGRYDPPADDDPLGVDAYFGSVRGARASVWDLERALRRGDAAIAEHGLRRLPGGELADADEALAYLVAMNFAERVWTEIMGARLTIATGFPRSEAQQQTLLALTEHFVASRFSLKTLITDVLAHPAFNLRAPDEGCGRAPYELPLLFDPFTLDDADLARRANGPGDAVFPLSSRALRRGLHAAMGWAPASEFPVGDEEVTLQASIGLFLKDAEPGFRGLDFQARLAWERAYAACPDRSPSSAAGDYVTDLAERSALANATFGDAVDALSDRLLGERLAAARAGGGDALLAGYLGASLDAASTDAQAHEAVLRRACGLFASTPQFLLGGLAAPDARGEPALTAPGDRYAAVCTDVASRVASLGAGFTVRCDGDALEVKSP